MVRNDSNNDSIIHGRDQEAKVLLDAYRKCCASSHSTPQLVLISGHSGTGKTSLVNSFAPVVQQDDGFFLSGKFELAAKFKEPYGAFKIAIAQLMDIILLAEESNNGNRISMIRQVAQEAVGTEGKLLTDMVPSLKLLIGNQSNTSNIFRTSETQRFHIVFSQFCQAIASVVPVVLFLDDLQFSDAASLDLLEALLLHSRPASATPSALLVVASYRDEDLVVRTDSNLMGMDESTRQNPTQDVTKNDNLSSFLLRYSTPPLMCGTEIVLKDLDESNTNLLVAGFLQNCGNQSLDDLSRIVYKTSKGNPFHAIQMLRRLTDQGYLGKGDGSNDNWVWDSQHLLKRCEFTETAEELIHRKLVGLPAFTLQVLQVAACMGDEIDENGICCVLAASNGEVERSIQNAFEEGLVVVGRKNGRYCFAHDRIRQVVLSTITDKEAFSFHIGMQLWKRSPPAYLCTNLYTVTNLLNVGINRMTDAADRYEAASLNLEAGAKAASLAAFPDSSRYLRAGIEFLKGGENDCWSNNYKLSLTLLSTAAETELCCQSYARANELAGEVLCNALSIQDKLHAYASLISSMGQQGRLQEAIDLGILVLAQLGEPLPHKVNKLEAAIEITKLKWTFRRRSDEYLLRLPPMHDEGKIAAMYIMTTLLPYVCQAGSTYTEVIARRVVQMYLKHGYHKGCALGFTKLSLLICQSDALLGCRLGKVAISILERSGAREFIPRVHMHIYGFTKPWTCPLRASLKPLDEVVKIGTGIGDVEYAMRALFHSFAFSLYCGMPLSLVAAQLSEAMRQLKQYKQEVYVQLARAFQQFVHSLTTPTSDKRRLSNERFSLSQTGGNAEIVEYHRFVLAADLAFTFGDFTYASQMLGKIKAISYTPCGDFALAIERFKEALISIACVRQDKSCWGKNIKIAKRGLKKMKAWAKSCPENFSHKRYLIEAELHSLKQTRLKSAGRRTQALYDQAIQHALNERYIQEAALGCELASNFMLSLQKLELAAEYHTRSQQLYLEWGAKEKASQLSATWRAS